MRTVAIIQAYGSGSIIQCYLAIHYGVEMRVIGKRSIASFLKFMIDFVWYSAIVAFGGALLLFIWMFFFSSSTYEIHGWPVYFEQNVESSGIHPISGDIDLLEIETDRARIGFRTSSDWQPKFIRLTSLIVGGCIILLIVRNLRIIIDSIVKNNPFNHENVTRFRKIALLFIGVSLFSAIRSASIAIYIRSRFVIDNPGNPFNPFELGVFGDLLRSINGHLIFIALVMLVLGEIFRLGLEYKEDSHSIV